MCEFEVKENVFTPHITIGRVKNYPKHWKELLSSTSFEEIKVFVNSIEIYSSELTKKMDLCTISCIQLILREA